MSRDIQIGQFEFSMEKPTKTPDRCMPEEVIAALKITPERSKEIRQIIRTVRDEVHRDIPEAIALLAKRITDPVEFGAVIYVMGSLVTEEKIINSLPQLAEMAMQEGARIAIDILNADPELGKDQKGFFPVTDPSVDPQYQ